jgi:hypothetical protein
MSKPDRPRTATHAQTHATPTSALCTVAVLLAVVLLIAAAVLAIDLTGRSRTVSGSPATTRSPSVSHAVLIAPPDRLGNPTHRQEGELAMMT